MAEVELGAEEVRGRPEVSPPSPMSEGSTSESTSVDTNHYMADTNIGYCSGEENLA